MHRRAILDGSVEFLEGRVLLSGGTQGAGSLPTAEIQPLDTQRATAVSLQSTTKTGGQGNRVILTALVHTVGTDRLVTAGRVRFSLVSPTPEVLGSTHLNRLGQAKVSTSRLNGGGPFQVQAQFIPAQAVFATSTGSVRLTSTEDRASSFRINAPQFFGAPGTPVTFSVTALDRSGQPVRDYTGTINIFSPTDHAAIFPRRQYTFTIADQGTHEFPGGVTFHKGGAELLKVDQVSNTQIRGKATFGIE